MADHQTCEDAIAAHTRAIADLLYEQARNALGRLREAERETLERIQQTSPRDYDYDAAAIYLAIPRRTLERRVADREISFRKDGKRVRFTKSALDQYKTTLTTNRRERRPLTL
ncbi:MAG: excisionase family DNA-binding protein [Chthoniobacteraceae bacterium]